MLANVDALKQAKKTKAIRQNRLITEPISKRSDIWDEPLQRYPECKPKIKISTEPGEEPLRP